MAPVYFQFLANYNEKSATWIDSLNNRTLLLDENPQLLKSNQITGQVNKTSRDACHQEKTADHTTRCAVAVV